MDSKKLPSLQLLKVVVPAVPAPSARTRRDTEDRLACNVATLFGVPWAANPIGHTWVTRFDDVSLREVAKGSPASEAAVSEVSTATLNRFRPDRKAGAVITGAERLLESLLAPARDVMRILSACSQGGQLHPETELIAWASIVQEAYRCQAALFVSAATARLVQRALLRDWGAVVRGVDPSAEADSKQGPPPLTPSTLPLLDRGEQYPLLPEVASTAEGEYDASARHASYGGPDLAEKWVNLLLDQRAGGIAWVERQDGQEAVVAYTASIELLNALIDDVVIGELVGKDSLLPRVPTDAELTAVSEQSRRLIIWCLLQLHRVFREQPRYQDVGAARHFQEQITQDARDLAALARQSLGEDDPLIPLARARAAHREVVDLRERDPHGARSALSRLRTDFDHLQMMYQTGQIDGGAIADIIRSFSSIFNALLTDARAEGDAEYARELAAQLRQDWDLFFSALGVHPSKLTSEGFKGSAEGRILASHLHNYATFLSNSDRWSERQDAIEIEGDVVLPARRDISARIRSENSYRLALQVLLRLIDRQLVTTPIGRERMNLAARARRLQADLLQTDRGRKVKNLEPGTAMILGEIHTATALLLSYLLVAEADDDQNELTHDDAKRLVEAARDALTQLSHQRDTPRLTELQHLQDRVEALQAPAE